MRRLGQKRHRSPADPLPPAVVLSLPANMSLSGGGLPQAYLAAQLHLHWGSHVEPGSEHTVDGHRYAGEVSPALCGFWVLRTGASSCCRRRPVASLGQA